MDKMVYDALSRYYHALEANGYMPYADAAKLLLLVFYRDFVYNDYRGRLTREDYRLIEKALDCLYGSTCLIPYPDYLKMGKLHIGEVTEMADRLKKLEDGGGFLGSEDAARLVLADEDGNEVTVEE